MYDFRAELCMYGSRGNRTAQPASPPQGICLCFTAAKFLSGGAPRRNCRLLSIVSYSLSPGVNGVFCVQYQEKVLKPSKEVPSSILEHTQTTFRHLLALPELTRTVLYKASSVRKFNGNPKQINTKGAFCQVVTKCFI